MATGDNDDDRQQRRPTVTMTPDFNGVTGDEGDDDGDDEDCGNGRRQATYSV
jgi:hypothetical protein